MLFIEAIEKYSSWRLFKVKKTTNHGYVYDLRSFCLYLHNPPLADVGLDDVLNYFKEMLALGWDHNVLCRKSMALRTMFKFFNDQNIKCLNWEIIPLIHPEPKVPRAIPEDVYLSLLASIPATRDVNIRDRALLQLLWDTGARNSEILSINVDDIDFKNMKVLIKTEKTRGRRPFREIFWTEGTNKALMDWVELRDKLLVDGSDRNAVFLNYIYGKFTTRMNHHGLRDLLSRRSERAKVPYYNPHAYRHRLAHDIIHQGGTNSDIMNILGHSRLESSAKYSQMENLELASRYKKFRGN